MRDGGPQDVVGSCHAGTQYLVYFLEGGDDVRGVRMLERVQGHAVDESVERPDAADEILDKGEVRIADEDEPFLIHEVKVAALAICGNNMDACSQEGPDKESDVRFEFGGELMRKLFLRV